MTRRFVFARNRMLRYLAESPDGCAKATLLAYGFPVALLDRLIESGLATASSERTIRGNKPIEVVRIKLTKAGRAALPPERHRGISESRATQ
jgi:hypothetical protein